jgi:CO/xanthine dehydrogenase Mo-binding subunit
VSYGELVADGGFALKLDHAKPAIPKDPRRHKIVGKPIPRADIPDKVMGRFTYMHDFRLRGMLHGRVVRPPALGARLESVDESSIKDIAGIVKVVRQGNFIGIVAQSEWAAIKAAQAIKATWSQSETLPEQAKLFDHVRATKVVKDDVTSNVGDVAGALAKDGTKKIAATYDFAIHTHGSIGPSCAVAEFKDGRLTSWSASQATHDLRKQLAQMLGMPVASVRCIYLEGAGCYGRNGHEDAAADAALLAKAVGRPVRVQWSRADEHGWDPKGPPTLMDLQAGMDDAGNVTAWNSQFFIPQAGPELNVALVAADLAGMPTAPVSFPGNIFQMSAIPYKFPNVKTVCHRLETTPLRPSWIRTPGRMQNTCANECFMDELAAAAGVDPSEFRRRHLDPDDKRGHEVLERLLALAKWDKRPSPQGNGSGNIGRGRGISYVKYELVRTYVGTVAEVEVDRATGVIRVPKFYLVHDCGQIINPDGLKNQLEGNIIQTVSRTLLEEVKFDRAQVTSLDWDSYPILTFPQIPDIVLELVDRPNERPWGAGEPAASVVPSAISNAVFDAIGVRLRSVPFTPGKVRGGL